MILQRNFEIQRLILNNNNKMLNVYINLNAHYIKKNNNYWRFKKQGRSKLLYNNIILDRKMIT